ncbi:MULTISPECIES: DUF1707 SHOCT-like domain-containing protein [Catenuloplanes]|uniref:DUF1707 domain-containing protein n=1 Tax=Catenuloplanes niger TaxID=587534 RepID=A0AAE3ZQ64_9ACTN|nr:DUF1707 domain-containing protein [Catenuloplanes niger]MDR7322881.1 hypothetical protein [Catenuloplanes niger]
MGREEMRAADADREAVAERLRVALGEGRLDLAEFDERLGRAYAAKTYGELDGLLNDLPDVASAERQGLAVPGTSAVPVAGAVPGAVVVPEWPVGADGRYLDATRRWLIENWAPYLGVVGIVVAIWVLQAVQGEDGVGTFWPGWVAGPWGIFLVIATIAGLASGEPQRWAAKQARKRLRKIQDGDFDE